MFDHLQILDGLSRLNVPFGLFDHGQQFYHYLMMYHDLRDCLCDGCLQPVSVCEVPFESPYFAPCFSLVFRKRSPKTHSPAHFMIFLPKIGFLYFTKKSLKLQASSVLIRKGPEKFSVTSHRILSAVTALKNQYCKTFKPSLKFSYKAE